MSALGEWLVTPATLLLAALGLIAGAGLARLLYEGFGALLGADEPGTWPPEAPGDVRVVWVVGAGDLPSARVVGTPGRRRDRRRTAAWAGWAVRLLAAVLLPVLCTAWVAVGLRLVEAGPVTRMLAALPLTAAIVPLVCCPLILLLVAFDGGRLATPLVVLAMAALLCGAFAGGWAVTLGLLTARGSETTCAVLGTEASATPAPPAGEIWLHTYALDCAAADAPDEITTFTAVRGERLTLLYDPSGLAGALPAQETDHSALTNRVAVASLALWTVLSVGGALRDAPLARDPNACP